MNSMPVDKAAVIARNVRHVRESIAAAAVAAQRQADSVRLVAITKYVSASIARLVVEAGCHDLGESRPQQLWEKSAALQELAPRWHLIGHLQRNKLARTLPLVELIHSIDSQRLLEALQTWGQEQNRTVVGLLEINISGDANKTGLAPDSLAAIIETAARSSHIRIAGMMGMAHVDGDSAQARRDFASLRELHAHWFRQGLIGPELSMGMSGDYVEAIAEGSTLVRIGSALFVGLDG